MLKVASQNDLRAWTVRDSIELYNVNGWGRDFFTINDAGNIGLSLNGKAFPDTEPVVANKGEYILIHFYNEGLVGHPMHLHRQPQLVVAKDGFPLEAPYQMDTIWVSPGERYSVLVKAEEEGVWAFHCHILNHAESNDGLIGMVTVMAVLDPDAKS